jgi:hypothetical protein
MLCWAALPACESCDDELVFRSGVRFRLTVLEDMTLCDALAVAQDDVIIVTAGETIVTDTSCDYTAAAGAPELPENDVVFNSCRPDANLLGTECAVALGDCGGGTMRFASGHACRQCSNPDRVRCLFPGGTNDLRLRMLCPHSGQHAAHLARASLASTRPPKPPSGFGTGAL